MPQFSEFDYYFAIDVLKISKSTIGLQVLYVGVFIFLMPLIYQKFFNQSEYCNFFLVSQIIYVIANTFKCTLVARYNL